MNCYMIAEIGFNHEGHMDVAAEMIKAAAEAGANAVKFQTFRASDIVLPSNLSYKAIQAVELGYEQHVKLFNIAKDYSVDFLSTPFGPWAVELLEKVGVSAYKVASMDCTNKHLLRYIAQTKRPIYLSTGMATLREIADTLEYLREEKSGAVTLLHCISLYPTKAEDLNLSIIPLLKQVFNTPVGYSDHYPGTKACLAAYMLGAEVIETHFTLDSSAKGGDHFHSAEPAELQKLVEDLKLMRMMYGKKESIFNRPDQSFTKQYRRGVYAQRGLPQNHILTEEDLLFTRPVADFTPSDLALLKGKVLQEAVVAYQAISKENIRETE